jgi:c-di-GMP-binding flagellar brake protein YcgR
METCENRGMLAARQLERRSDLRYSVDEDSVVPFVGHGVPQEARLVDLSQEGCRLRTTEPVLARVRLPVEVFFNVDGISFRFRGVLQWTDGHRLIGVRFVNIIPQRMVELANIVCGMEKTAAVRAEAVNLLVAEYETSKRTGREAIERAVKGNPQLMAEARMAAAQMQLTEAGRAVTPAFVAEDAQPASHPPAGRERRQQSRHEVSSSVTILLVNDGSTLRGRILDMSVTGCRIRTDERFPAGIHTRVETEFRLENLPLRLGGVIQSIYDRNTVGIRFLDLSEREREQVQGLIGEIEQLRILPPEAGAGTV